MVGLSVFCISLKESCWGLHLAFSLAQPAAVADSACVNHPCHAEYLFPEAYVRTEYSSLQEVPPSRLQAALTPRCSLASSRLAALRLLKELTQHSSGNLQTSLQLIQQLHLSAEGSACMDSMPVHAIRLANRLTRSGCACQCAHA